jgi:hypothetical protein
VEMLTLVLKNNIARRQERVLWSDIDFGSNKVIQ